MTEPLGGAASPSISKIVSGWKSGSGVKPLPIPEAAKRLGVAPQTVYEWLSKGKLRPASLNFTEGGNIAGQAMVLPVDPALIQQWNGESASGTNGNGASPAVASAAPASSPVADIQMRPAAPIEKVIERIIERPALDDESRAKFESEIAFLKGRIEEMEKSIAWERDARAKVEGEIQILRQEKAKLEGQLQLSTKVEKSLQKYTDKLESELKVEREKKA